MDAAENAKEHRETIEYWIHYGDNGRLVQQWSCNPSKQFLLGGKLEKFV